MVNLKFRWPSINRARISTTFSDTAVFSNWQVHVSVTNVYAIVVLLEVMVCPKIHKWLHVTSELFVWRSLLTYQTHSQPRIERDSVPPSSMQRLHSSRETEQKKKNWPLFAVISESSHSNFMLCTAPALLSAFMHNTILAFLLIPTITGSHMLCRHSSHVILLSSLGGSIKPLKFPLATALAYLVWDAGFNL